MAAVGIRAGYRDFAIDQGTMVFWGQAGFSKGFTCIFLLFFFLLKGGHDVLSTSFRK